MLESDKNRETLFAAGVAELAPSTVAAVAELEELLALPGLVPAPHSQFSVTMSKDALVPELTVAGLPIATDLSFVLGFARLGLEESLAVIGGKVGKRVDV